MCLEAEGWPKTTGTLGRSALGSRCPAASHRQCASAGRIHSPGHGNVTNWQNITRFIGNSSDKSAIFHSNVKLPESQRVLYFSAGVPFPGFTFGKMPKFIKDHVQQLQVTGKPSSKMFPSTSTLPRLLTRPANTFSSEVFPAPEGPINAQTSPPFIEPLMSFRMFFLSLPISTVIFTDRHEKLESFFPSSSASGDTAVAIVWSKAEATRSRTGKMPWRVWETLPNAAGHADPAQTVMVVSLRLHLLACGSQHVRYILENTHEQKCCGCGSKSTLDFNQDSCWMYVYMHIFVICHKRFWSIPNVNSKAIRAPGQASAGERSHPSFMLRNGAWRSCNSHVERCEPWSKDGIGGYDMLWSSDHH